MIGDIRQSASNLVSFLEQNKFAQIYPYFRSYFYPEGCCESVSLIFIYLMKAKYPSAKARVVRGTNTKQEHHFWVEIEGLIFDLTAHQFEPFETPILGEKSSSLTKEYEPDDQGPNYDFVDESTIVALHWCGVIRF